jgi:hypothetical protein
VTTTQEREGLSIVKMGRAERWSHLHVLVRMKGTWYPRRCTCPASTSALIALNEQELTHNKLSLFDTVNAVETLLASIDIPCTLRLLAEILVIKFRGNQTALMSHQVQEVSS